MTEIIKVNYETADRPTVSGRELHEALGVETRYNDWFKRMCEYGFTERKDFYSILSKTPDVGRPATDHSLTIPMAKELTAFIQLMQSLNAQEQAGLLILIQGAKMLAKKEKRRITHRFPL